MSQGPSARRPRIGASIAAGLGILVLLGLGTWQVQRAGWKAALQAALDERLAMAPEALPATIDDPQRWLHRRAVVTGVFDHAHEATVLAPSREGKAGYHVVTPLIRDGGAAVLADRGWVPLEARDPASRAAGRIEGPVTVQGIVTVPPAPGLFTPEADPAKGAWYWFDLAALAAAAGVEAPPVLLEASDAAVPGGLPKGGQTITTLRNEHRGYAATWYALAAVLGVVYVLFVRRERRGNRP
jgi:surfeit locus 1 family protein